MRALVKTRKGLGFQREPLENWQGAFDAEEKLKAINAVMIHEKGER